MSNSDMPAGRKGLRILVADDEYMIATDIAYMVNCLGHEVVGPAPRAEEALALIRGEEIDGVLLDANLGGTSSAAVAAELEARSMPFVVVTGYGDLKLVSPELDDAPRVSKPLGVNDLDRAIAAHFSA